jgi:hypothetical protein
MKELIELQKLVRRYIDGQCGYAAFRAEFVHQYLSRRHERSIEDLIHEIEGSCADFDEDEVAENDLRDDLRTIADAPVISIEVLAPIEAQSLWLGRSSLAPDQARSDKGQNRVVPAAA